MNPKFKVVAKWEAWMYIANPDLSFSDAVEKLKALGNPIIELDEAGRRVKVLQQSVDPKGL